MKKGAFFLAGLISLAQSDPRFLQFNSITPYQIIPSDPYYISPGSSSRTFQPSKSTFDPYVPTSPWTSNNDQRSGPQDFSSIRF